MHFISIVESRNLKKISAAIADGADVDRLDPSRNGMTALMHACSDASTKAANIISMLIDAGADVNYVRQSDEMTPLKFAAGDCSGECLEKLIAAGAIVDFPAGTNQTALMLAARANNVEAIDVLVKHGADLHYPCRLKWAKGKDALWLAGEEKSRKATKRLKELMSDHPSEEKTNTAEKCFSELIDELNKWLKKHRKGFYKELNRSASPASISKLETSLGIKLPEEFKLMLRWKNGQKQSNFDTFHPNTNEMYMGTASIIETATDLNELLDHGDIDEGVWNKLWLPLMDNGGGDYTCIDLSPRNHGKIVRHSHEGGSGKVLFESLSAWLTDLLEELNTLAFDNWDFEQES